MRILAALLVAFLAVGCETNITNENDNRNDNINEGPFDPTAVPSGDSDCGEISRIATTVSPGLILTNQDFFTIEASPLNENGELRDAECDEALGIVWDTVGACALNTPGFVAQFKCLEPGTCSITGRVGNTSTGVINVTCEPAN